MNEKGQIVEGSVLAPEAVKCPNCGEGDCEDCKPCEYCGEYDCNEECDEAHECRCSCIDDYICDYCIELKREARYERMIEAYEDARFERTGKYY